MAVVGGAVMGVAFGTFMGTMDTGTGNAMLGGVAVEPGTTARQVLKDMVKSIRVKSVSYAKVNHI